MSISPVLRDYFDNAYVEASKTGKTPELCSSGSPFFSDYNACQECISANSLNPAAAIQNFLNPRFEEFIQYCASPNETSIASTPSGSPYTTIAITNTQSIPLLDGITTSTVTFTNTITLWTQTSSTSFPSPTNLQSTLTPGHAQFHGVVFGSIFGGLAIIAFGMIYWKFWRYRHLRKSKVGAGIGDETGPEKAQLHSDCIPPKTPEEIDGAPKGPVAELPAIEAVVEMPGSVKNLPREVG
ncbi:hypothetical protein BELL_0076g00070 [Botrytis elliptica]|uniref:Uncharacterized protein n=1 Tax=Botrytis elliptica TaxID=278938 RepID=A0A4Z1JW95_9HELO|nr:hypothetical protein BELL_0076g00070 [Botrytis elliptica]